MRLFVFFDLPTESVEDKRQYRRFRKTLLKNGFVMLQESVYCRLFMTPSAGAAAVEIIRKNKPTSGIVQLLSVTEKQFSRMEYLVGEHQSELIDSDERLIVL